MEKIKQDMELKAQGYEYSQPDEPTEVKFKSTKIESKIQSEGEGNIYEYLKAIGWEEA